MNLSRPAFDDPRVALGAQPISEAAPAGASPRGGARFDALEGEIRRLETEGPAAVGWSDVIATSRAILTVEGKDLFVAVWLAHALHRSEGWRGLAAGLGLLAGLVRHHWEALSPERPRARAGALRWLDEKSPPLCAEPVREGDLAAILAAEAWLAELDAVLAERMPAEEARPTETARALRARRAEIDRLLAERQAESLPERPAEAGAVAETPPCPLPPADGPSGEPSLSAETLAKALRRLASALVAQDPTDPRGHWLIRVASWWRVRHVPASRAGRIVAMPPADEILQIERLGEAGREADALQALTELCWSSPFHLDAHRRTAELLGRLGRGYEEARSCVEAATAMFVRLFPDLLDLSFADGTPLADAATRDWLGERGGSATAPAEEWENVLGRARALVGAGRASDGVELIAGLTRGVGPGRTLAQRYVAQARFCLEVGLVAAAIPLLDHLELLLQTHGLDSWEPDLALAIGELRYRALTHSDAARLLTEERRRQDLETTRRRLVRHDLAAASRLLR